jgi:hypothetical protein
MTLAETSLSIEELEEQVRTENDRRYTFNRLLNATDRVLWRLENLNAAGVKDLPAAVAEAIGPALAELPAACLELLRGGKVQDALDSVFAAQDRLFALYVPGYQAESAEAEEATG